jgi:class 3 adenylate cyclase
MEKTESTFKKSNERRRFPLPRNPGNYPRDYIHIIETALRKYPNQIPLDKSFQAEVDKAIESRGILLCADLRNFTKTYEEYGAEKVQTFLRIFFKRASDILNRSMNGEAYINKFLGDGLFVHIPNEKLIDKAIGVARNLILFTNGTKKGYKFRYANISVAISVGYYTRMRVGEEYYEDYTLYHPNVNSLFRMLSKTEGGMIWVSHDTKLKIQNSYFTVYVGNLAFKGIVPSIPAYSIIRKKRKNEDINSASQECNYCGNYRLCKRAWDKGKEHAFYTAPNDYVFDLDCNECGEKNNQCWHWTDCLQKEIHVKNSKLIRCCYMCKNYRNCFHSYQLGRQGQPMISCDWKIYENFIISL